ncbi:hypothetical protein L2E82_44153 [Cichorium intybus]|uniref:Uncharacterized protein n=1 Tax=Cichorium intybus TaxID=13427 RepID=A0ACB8ZQ13_CICIN|nr:hypothetical protein L2E82_44153 [Cichorium intybus]
MEKIEMADLGDRKSNQEIDNCPVRIQSRRQFYRNIMGESPENMPEKDLKNLKSKLKKDFITIRSKKNELLFAEIEYMQKRMLSAQTTYSCSISEDFCQKRKQIRSEAAD